MVKNIINYSDIFISSSDREVFNSNILQEKTYYLPPNPLSLESGSNLIKIKIPGNDFAADDIITIRNVVSESFDSDLDITLTPCFIAVDISQHIEFFRGIQRTTVRIVSNAEYILKNVPVSTFNDYLDISYEINILNNRYLVLFLSNLSFFVLEKEVIRIRFGEIEDFFECGLSATNLSIDVGPLGEGVFTNRNSVEVNVITSDELLFGQVRISYVNNIHNILILNETQLLIPINSILSLKGLTQRLITKKVKLIVKDVAGVPLSKINAFYPINADSNAKGFHEVESVDGDFVYVALDHIPSVSESPCGGGRVLVNRVETQIVGYPDNNSYSISLPRTFYDIISLELKSSYFPKIFRVISSKNKNNVFKWSDTNNNVYSVTLREYNYSLKTLLEELSQQINKVMYLNNMSFYSEYIIKNDYFYELYFFTKRVLDEPFTYYPTTDNTSLARRNKVFVNFPDHNLSESNDIRISGARSFLGIPEDWLNAEHKITVLDKNTFFFNIQRFNVNRSTLTENNSGGTSVTILIKKKVAVKKNQFSEFIKIGTQMYSDTLFNSAPAKVEPNSFNIILDINGQKTINNFTKEGLKNILGKVFVNSDTDSLLNCHSKTQLLFKPPLKSLYTLNFRFEWNDGSLVDFFNIEHEFVLTIKYLDVVD